MSATPHQTTLSLTLALLGPLLEMTLLSPQRRGAPLTFSPQGRAPLGATVVEPVLPGKGRWGTPSLGNETLAGLQWDSE